MPLSEMNEKDLHKALRSQLESTMQSLLQIIASLDSETV
jgi:hypothetical protein